MQNLSRIARAVALVVLSCACVAVLCLSFAILFGLIAVLIVVILTAYALNPKDVKAIASALADRVNKWIDQLRAIVTSMMEIIRTMAEVAKAATQEQSAISARELKDNVEPSTKEE